MKKLKCNNFKIDSILSNYFFSKEADAKDIYNYFKSNNIIDFPLLIEPGDKLTITKNYICISTDEQYLEIEIEEIKPIF